MDDIFDSTTTPVVTIEKQVEEVVKQFTFNEDKNVWELPDTIKNSLPHEVAYAANLEKRRRDTQSHATKQAERVKELESQVEALKAQKDLLVDKTLSNVHLGEESLSEELQNLQYNNPEEWRRQVNALEAKLVGEKKQQLLQELSEAEQAAAQQAIATNRIDTLNDYKKTYPDIDFDNLDKYISHATYKEYSDGHVTFRDLLDVAVKAHTDSQPKTTIQQPPQPPQITNMNNFSGTLEETKGSYLADNGDCGYF